MASTQGHARSDLRRRFSCVLARWAIFVGLVLTSGYAEAQVGPRALPSLLTTPRIVRPEHTYGTLGASAGYGMREKFGGAESHRHTALGSLAAAINHHSGIGGELRLDGRVEVPESSAESRAASVGALRGFVRVSPGLYKNFDLGMELGVWIPGGKAPSLRLDATTVDALMAFDARLTENWALVGAGGFRLDHSREAIPQSGTLSRDDWVVLGLSNWNAALARFGSELKLGRTRSFVEWTWDIFVGKTAPDVMKSPMHAALGTRIDLDKRGSFVLNLSVRALLSQRARVDVQGPVIPFPPRFEVWTGLAYQIGGRPPEKIQVATEVAEKTKPAEAPPQEEPAPVVASEVPPAETPAPEPAADAPPATAAAPLAAAAPAAEDKVPPGQLRFLVRDHETGEPLTANIIVTPLGSGGQPIEHKAGADGRFELELSPGRYDVTVKLYGWRKQKKTVDVEDESVTLIDAALHPRSHKKKKR